MLTTATVPRTVWSSLLTRRSLRPPLGLSPSCLLPAALIEEFRGHLVAAVSLGGKRSITGLSQGLLIGSALIGKRACCLIIRTSAGSRRLDYLRRVLLSSASSQLCSNTVIRMSSSLVLRLVASSVRVADRSGSIVRDIMKAGNLGIVDKGINDLQTEADRSVQRCILASLHKQFPGLSIIGEEDDDSSPIDPKWIEMSLCEDVLSHEDKLPNDLKTVKTEEVCVWVDPLDGTAEYTQGLLDHVTVLIGISVNGKAVAGVIHQPYYNYQAGPDAPMGRTIWGIIGVGAFGFEPKVANPNERIVVTTRSHETEGVRNAIAACQPTQVHKVGGAGHKVLLLIEGKAHAYIFASPGCKKWDTCAPEAVLHSIGGKLTDIHGNAFQYHKTVKKQNTGGVLGTAKASELEWYLSKIPEDVKASLPE